MLGILDYGVGNLFSIRSSLAALGVDSVVTADQSALSACSALILPGVGAFEKAAKKLHDARLDTFLLSRVDAGIPLLGICLGMQMLFEKSYEYGVHDGLGLIPGAVRPIADVIPKGLKIPQIGWNGLIFPKDHEKSALYHSTEEGKCVYFVHSYYADTPDEYISAKTEYGALLTASVERENVYGCQFHPEKSGNVGLSILRAFCEIGGCI